MSEHRIFHIFSGKKVQNRPSPQLLGILVDISNLFVCYIHRHCFFSARLTGYIKFIPALRNFFTLQLPLMTLRNVFVITLLGCLFLYMGGYWMVNTYQQFERKKEVREKLLTSIPREETEQFVFDLVNGEPAAAGLYWEEADEFHFNGTMYDVISKETINGKLYIRCINDHKEQELKNKLSDLTQKQNSKSSAAGISFQWLIGLSFIAPSSFVLKNLSIQSSNNYPSYKASLLHIALDIVVPPPQC